MDSDLVPHTVAVWWSILRQSPSPMRELQTARASPGRRIANRNDASPVRRLTTGELAPRFRPDRARTTAARRLRGEPSGSGLRTPSPHQDRRTGRRIRASAANHPCPVSRLVEDGRVSGKRQIHRATAANVVEDHVGCDLDADDRVRLLRSHG